MKSIAASGLLRAASCSAWAGLLDLLYPAVCLVCRCPIDAGPLCARCASSIQPVPQPLCPGCGNPIGQEGGCTRCQGVSVPYRWSAALGLYTGELRTAIQLLKYRRRTALARPLGWMLADCLNSHCSGEVPGSPGVGGFDVVAPVPLHPSRYRKRGFNQAELIALALSDRSGWPMDAGCLRRVKRTHSQTTLDLQHRADNMKGAFRAAPERVAGRHVLIVDDVTTTTATLQECAAVVMEAGAACVWVAAVARTP